MPVSRGLHAVNDLTRYLEALWSPGEVRELRIPRWDGYKTAAGWFDDPTKLAAAVKEWDGKANLYVTLNPVNPALLARAQNRVVRRAANTTADPDVERRRWIYIDIDPVRPAGISSTETEQAAALHTARDVSGYLAEHGWPIPIVAMSGNGYALIVPIDLPNTPDSLALVHGFLRHLGSHFDSEQVTIDPTVSNAARIVALIGTMKVKGDSTPERPHRRSALVWVPEAFQPITVEQLQALQAAPEAPKSGPPATDTDHGWVKRLLDAHGVTHREQPPDAAGITWYGVEHCPFHPDDGAPWQCGVGERPDGAATGKCFHNRGAGMGWQDFKRVLGLPESGGRVHLLLNGHKPAVAGGPGMDAADLLELDLPPLRWIVPDLIPEGTTILAAPPKVGKSCLVYQMAVEATVGGDLLGRRVTPGSVLYLALEDGQRRGQQRLRAALAGRTMPRGRLEIRWSAPRIGEGLEEEIVSWLDRTPDALLVAIDTLGKVRPAADGRRNAYDVDVADMARLQDLFRNRPVGLVIVHHLRKEHGDDFLTAVSGTYGITGSADTTAVIRRKRLEQFGTLTVTGRDIPEIEASVRFDGMTWSAAPKPRTELSYEREAVMGVIEQRGPIFPKAIAELLEKERTAVQHLVTGLASEGLIQRVEGGYVANQVQIVSSTPHNSTHSDRQWSDTGYARARAHAAREEEPIANGTVAQDVGSRFLRLIEGDPA